jgi:cell division protein ZapE
MALIEQYKRALQQPDMVHDAAQEQAVLKLAALNDELSEYQRSALLHAFGKYSPLKRFRAKPAQGLYIWGSVGRGKTWLMNLFYDELTITEKKRMHFHHFMLDIHRQLGALKKQKNPLHQIARQLAKKYRVICIDEFIVTNITDAMILSELLHHLFRNGVCLVATSNRVPDNLYLNGLQRERFLPAIELIKKYNEVFHLDSGIDHRTSLLESADVYYYPVVDSTELLMEQRMRELAITVVVEKKVLTILDREIITIRCCDEIAWFDFDIICTTPRAAQDYILIAQQYSTVIISNIPVLDEHSDDKARRFIYLIDALYDRNVKLIASASSEPEKIYRGNMLEFAFHRTSSRLIEMRSHQYLSKSHKAFK